MFDNVKEKIDKRFEAYIDQLNESSIDDLLPRFEKIVKILWAIPIFLWSLCLILTIFPFHTLNHSFLLIWIGGVAGMILSFLANRMLMNLTTRRTDIDQDHRVEELLGQKKTMDYQVAITFGGLTALPFVYTAIPYTQFLLDNPTIPGVNRQMVELIAGPGLFNNIIWTLAPILFTVYMLSRLRKSEMEHQKEVETWMSKYEYHNVKLHKVLNGDESSDHEPNIVLGTSLETGDFVVQNSSTRRQNTVAYGPIGCGKTSRFFLPQIRQDIDSYLQYIRYYKKASQQEGWMKAYGDATHYLNGFNVIDPTNDLCKEVYTLCMKLGVPRDKVIWLDPENPRTPGLNLLLGPVEKAAENVTNIIAGLTSSNNDFFKQSERTHLKNMIYLLKLTSVMEDKIASFGDLIEMYNDIELVWDKMEILDEYCSELKQRAEQARQQYDDDNSDDNKIAFEELDDKYAVAWQTSQWFHKNIQEVTVGKNVRLYASGPHQGKPMHYDAQDEFVHGLLNQLGDISKNIPIRRVLFRDSGDFNLDDFLYNGGILLCNTAKAVVGDQLAETLGQIYTLSFQAATYRRDPNCPPLHPLYADEFPDYLSESFSGFASQARKYNVPIEIVAQSPAQLAYKYGDDYFKTLMSVMLTRVTFGDLGANDAEELSPYFGEHEETTESLNNQEVDLAADQDSNRQMISARRELVPNITASEIMGLERFTMAVRTPGQHGSDMFNRVRTKRVSDEQLNDDPYKFDMTNDEDRESYEYMLEHEVHDNPDFDEIDKSIMKEIKKRPKEENGSTTTSINNESNSNDSTYFDIDDADDEISRSLVNKGGHKTVKDIKQKNDLGLLRSNKKSSEGELGHDEFPHPNIKFVDFDADDDISVPSHKDKINERDEK